MVETASVAVGALALQEVTTLSPEGVVAIFKGELEQIIFYGNFTPQKKGDEKHTGAGSLKQKMEGFLDCIQASNRIVLTFSR